ncbi:FAD-binding domain-containing protein [Sandarakinorhabdus sp.]|uniref:FAD-binding domain-containing protein n=1 Tax=Sandarakinorhabdus sp. TaxID=1916663 RepID=UPI00286DC72E|nr:FAD-binding domain-containing protein [Sandarakinorhabdus sp.]
MTNRDFPATRAAGLERLAAFVPMAGHAYSTGRNTDPGPDALASVSLLSPYVRHRLVSERDVAAAVLAHSSLGSAEKFLQEVLWRTYWKGWLEMRPAVWTQFVAERDRMRDAFPNARALAAAEAGMTGIEGFDDWARELVATGYLHNHARMWFASIWIFTLRLPWALGADFFLRHLIDADAASNTLSWRWVAGLQTPGKIYLAGADNIARYSGGRFAPAGLAKTAQALTEESPPAPRPLPAAAPHDDDTPALLLVTHEDMSPETLFSRMTRLRGAIVLADAGLAFGDPSARFAAAAATDTAQRIAAMWSCPVTVMDRLDTGALAAAAQAADVRRIVTPYAPVGPVADALRDATSALAGNGITLSQARRSWDARFWPHATKGFFPFKAQMAAGLMAEGVMRA